MWVFSYRDRVLSCLRWLCLRIRSRRCTEGATQWLFGRKNPCSPPGWGGASPVHCACVCECCGVCVGLVLQNDRIVCDSRLQTNANPGNHVHNQDRGLGSSNVAATRFAVSCICSVAWSRLACRARLRAPVPYDSVEPAPGPACASVAPRQD